MDCKRMIVLFLGPCFANSPWTYKNETFTFLHIKSTWSLKMLHNVVHLFVLKYFVSKITLLHPCFQVDNIDFL